MTDKLDNDELLRIALDSINHDRHAEAVSVLKTLLERDSRHVHATYLLAAEYAQLGMLEKAVEGFRLAVDLAPDFPMVRFQMGQLYLVMGDAYAAKQELLSLSELPLGQALANYTRGMIAVASEDLVEAVQYLRAGLACEQEVPALAMDMRRTLDGLLALVANDAPLVGAAVAIAPVVAPMYLSNYDRANN